MKRILMMLAAIAMIAGFTACKSGGSSFEKDVRKRAEMMCDVQKLTAKVATDSSFVKDLDKLKKEIEEYDAKMEKKYEKEPSAEETAKATKIIEEIMAKCK
jgi:hypothetical protein